jgi:endonuclease/exonuclease/phosphatase family metal-dependent hydrolase
MTWNLWWRFGPWQARQPAIAAVLAEVAPDLAFLQEVWADPHDGDQARTLARPLDRHVARSTRASGDPFPFGNAILSRWPIRRSDTVVLPGIDGGPSHRSGVVAEIGHPDGAFLAVCTHLEWRYDQTALRQRQLDHLLVTVREWMQASALDRPVVLAGDFNAVPDSDEIRRLTGASTLYGDPAGGAGPVFTDSWAAVSDEPGHTWTRDNPHSVDAQWPRRRLDYVFVSWPRPKPLGNPMAASLVGHEPIAGVVPSDHFAVVVELDDRSPQESTE